MMDMFLRRNAGRLVGPLMLTAVVFCGFQSEVQASALPTAQGEVQQEKAIGFAGEEIVRSLQQKGTDRNSFKISEVDADIVLDAVALTVGPEVR